jgi:S-DNA-T family DNA segregation ATPase FtsK/SpoIIIE
MERPEIYHRGIGVVTAAVALILLMSLASYDPHDVVWGGRHDYPPNALPSNACGTVGAYLADGMRFLFGTGSFLLVIAGAVAGGFLIAGNRLRDPWIRVLGGALIVLAWCIFFARVLPEGGGLQGRGGIVGHFGAKIVAPLGLGAYIVLAMALLLGALLAADAFVFWLGRKSVEILTMHGEAPKVRSAKRVAMPVEKRPDPEDRMAEQKELLRKRLAERESAESSVDAPPVKKPPSLALEAPEAPTLAARARAARKTIVKPPKPERRDMGDYVLPPLDLLDPLKQQDPQTRGDQMEIKREVLERTLEEFGIAAQVVEIDRGPVITQFELELAPGVKITKIIGLSDDIARALKATSVRVVAPIPGKSTVGVEVPNAHREIVQFRELMESGVLGRKRMTLPLLLGKDASGEPLVSDLAQMPHLLIAGATGSGKSVCMNSIIMTFLMTQSPEDVKLLLIDPKMVELSAFRDIPHLMSPVLTDMKKAAAVLEWATHKMDERYSLLANVGVRNIAGYNALGEKEIRKRLDAEPDDDLEGVPFRMPYIVIIIDELADLMMVSAKDVENTITRLAQKSRAVGIHLIVATQRPSVDVVTGLIKANLPSRLAFQTASRIDARTILDRNGPEKLLGQGDMLFMPPGTAKLIRGQGTFTSDEEIKRVVGFLSERARPRFDQELMRPQTLIEGNAADLDPLYDEAVRIIVESQRGSVSLLQRKLGIGYSRASRLIDIMGNMGIVGDYKGSQAREVLLSLEEFEAQQGGETIV